MPSAEEIISAFFPRTVGAVGENFPRRALAGTLDAASIPGRAYSSLWHRYNEPMLQNMARTGATPDMNTAGNVAEGMIRDPLTLLSAPVGGLAGSGGRALASGLGSALLRRAAPVAADAAANAGLSALSQYGTEGRIDPGALAANAGLGLGMRGAGMMWSKAGDKYSDLLHEHNLLKKAFRTAEKKGESTGDLERSLSSKESEINDFVKTATPELDTYDPDDFRLAVRKAYESGEYPSYGVRVNSKNPNTGESYPVGLGEYSRPSYYNEGGASSGGSHGASAIEIGDDNWHKPFDIVDDYIGLGDETILLGTKNGRNYGVDPGEIEMNNPDILAIFRDKKSVKPVNSIVNAANQSAASFAGGQPPIAGANALAGRYFRGLTNQREEERR